MAQSGHDFVADGTHRSSQIVDRLMIADYLNLRAGPEPIRRESADVNRDAVHRHAPYNQQ